MKKSALAIAIMASGGLLIGLQPAFEPSAIEPAAEPQPTVIALQEQQGMPTLPALPAARAASTASLGDDAREAAKSRMTRAVQALAEAGGTAIVNLVVAYESSDFEQEAARIRALGGHVLGRYDALGMMNVRIPAEKLYAMAGSETLKVADLNAEVHTSALSARAVTEVPKTGDVDHVATDASI